MSEAKKILPKIEKYLGEDKRIIDVGCGDQKVVDWATGIDIRDTSETNITTDFNDNDNFLAKDVDVVFSSHLLEHLIDPLAALREWMSWIKKGGHLILYLPDAKFYNNRNNPEHYHSFEYEVFARLFIKVFEKEFKLIEHGSHYSLSDHYSFYIIAEKL